jgi:hypothetical protein
MPAAIVQLRVSAVQRDDLFLTRMARIESQLPRPSPAGKTRSWISQTRRRKKQRVKPGSFSWGEKIVKSRGATPLYGIRMRASDTSPNKKSKLF